MLHIAPDLQAHLGCRQLQERYNDAVVSFATEILMTLRGLGVEEIQGGAGQFNPQPPRVVDKEMTTRPDMDGHVAKIVRAGFTWNGMMLRPEEVIVYKCKKGAQSS